MVTVRWSMVRHVEKRFIDAQRPQIQTPKEMLRVFDHRDYYWREPYAKIGGNLDRTTFHRLKDNGRNCGQCERRIGPPDKNETEHTQF